jgi:S1-C subfamily serine protease
VRLLILVWFLVFGWVQSVAAQSGSEVVWVQIEAHSTLSEAQKRAELIAAELEDVNGFTLGNGWYGIALGPYRRTDAQRVLDVYRAQGQIPRDSYIALSGTFRQQFFPPGADILRRGALETSEATTPTQAEQEQQTVQEQIPPQASDETPQEARNSERQLSKQEREKLQIALEWAGHYSGGIDGAFGRGTRNAMKGWQVANGFDPTGILTTLQRETLISQYNAVLDGLDLAYVLDAEAGIEIKIPKALVQFDRHDYPFAHYTAMDQSGVQVLLISQEGSESTLAALYDVMQTLEIVPMEGPRQLKRSRFELIGESEQFISHTEASLNNGQIKGFTLIWPTGDETRRTRLIEEMRASLTRTDAVLTLTQARLDEQAFDLLSGLEVRKPDRAGSGFFTDKAGTLVTSFELVNGCTRITIDDESEASITSMNPDLGLAVLTPQTSLAPRQVAQFANGPTRLRTEIAVGGYPYDGVLDAPTLSVGRLVDMAGLRGEEHLLRLSIGLQRGDVGGPVLSETGAVIGMITLPGTTPQQLPAKVQFALKADKITAILPQTIFNPEQQQPLQAAEIAERARGMTALISCWE